MEITGKAENYFEKPSTCALHIFPVVPNVHSRCHITPAQAVVSAN